MADFNRGQPVVSKWLQLGMTPNERYPENIMDKFITEDTPPITTEMECNRLRRKLTANNNLRTNLSSYAATRAPPQQHIHVDPEHQRGDPDMSSQSKYIGIRGDQTTAG